MVNAEYMAAIAEAVNSFSVLLGYR